jgi:hypothetical protein
MEPEKFIDQVYQIFKIHPETIPVHALDLLRSKYKLVELAIKVARAFEEMEQQKENASPTKPRTHL